MPLSSSGYQYGILLATYTYSLDVGRPLYNLAPSRVGTRIYLDIVNGVVSRMARAECTG
jgi:hypothetical protein